MSCIYYKRVAVIIIIAYPKTSIDKEAAAEQIRSRTGRIVDTLTKQQVGILLFWLSLVRGWTLYIIHDDCPL